MCFLQWAYVARYEFLWLVFNNDKLLENYSYSATTTPEYEMVFKCGGSTSGQSNRRRGNRPGVTFIHTSGNDSINTNSNGA